MTRTIAPTLPFTSTCEPRQLCNRTGEGRKVYEFVVRGVEPVTLGTMSTCACRLPMMVLDGKRAIWVDAIPNALEADSRVVHRCHLYSSESTLTSPERIDLYSYT